MQFELAAAVEDSSALLINLRTGVEKSRLRDGGSVLYVASADVTRQLPAVDCRVDLASLQWFFESRHVLVDLVSDFSG